jgi:uncharacterized protein YjiS (DUF1127 family)
MALVTHHGVAGLGHAEQSESLFERLGAIFRTWQKRGHERAELARMSERDLHDIGLSRLDAINEIDKPFWRA